MSGYTSKSLPDHVASRFEDLQPEQLTVGEFMQECLDAYETMNGLEQGEVPEDGYEFAPSPSNPNPGGNPTVDVDLQEVLARLDDLEAELPRKTARELESRFR